MVLLALEFALFFLVLFVLVPGIVISVRMLRKYVHQHNHHASWQKDNPTHLAG